MTTAQESTLNLENNTPSKGGPKTAEGKERSRRNALTHGLTAKLLSLDNDDFLKIQVLTNDFMEACQPETTQEVILVGELAHGAVQLERCAKNETQILSKQCHNVEHELERVKQNSLVELKRYYLVDSVKAVIALKHSGEGVNWLLELWGELKMAFDTHKCFSNLNLVKEFVKLCGYDAENLRNESIAAFEITSQAIACFGNPTPPKMADYLDKQTSGRWNGIFKDGAEFPRGESIEVIGERIAEEIAALKKRAAMFEVIDAAEREGAKDRAMVPYDTPENRLFLRYMKSAGTGFDRTLRTLTKLQADRKKAEENEARLAREADPRNEPKITLRANSNHVHPGSYIRMNGLEYVVEDVGDGHIMMAPVDANRVPMHPDYKVTDETPV